MNICTIELVIFIAFHFASGVISQDIPVSQRCLGCICEATSSCNITKQCSDNVCGRFSITKEYWADSGKPTVNGESPDATKAYQNCAGDKYCSILSVQGYMIKYQQDCDGNGEINCDDFTAIHLIGGYHCKNTKMPEKSAKRYNHCKENLGQFEL